ncbi:MAG: DUF4173 domain-containing protein [Chloroflexi bacterium]|nr:DUF4173 domain-containing protein [Chloroflexota bacterium]MBP8058947.1 DUF4173 domain-containing protein [Chloroflexota bacterium]
MDDLTSTPVPSLQSSESSVLSRLQMPTRVLTAGLFLGWLFDLLFYGKMLGVSVFLFAAALLAVLGALTVYEKVRPRWNNILLVPAILFFAAMVFVRVNGFLTFLNVSMILALLMVLAHYYAAANLFYLRLRDGILIPLFVTNYALWYGGQTIHHTIRKIVTNPKEVRRVAPFFRGVLLALPILFIFTALLASSDLIFADYLERLLAWETLDNLVEYTWRGLLILGLAWVLTGALVYTLVREAESEKQPDDSLDWLPLRLGFIETTTILTLINALFIFFGWVQLAYLFGGRANITIEGFTYSEYARRGFFELVAVAILTLGLILGLHWFSHRETKGQTRGFNLLSSVLAGLVLLLLASAFLRLQLYELTYGFTELRLYSHVFMVWLGLLFVGLVLLLWTRPQRITLMMVAAAVGFVATLNLINPDVFIVRQNLARYEKIHDLDAEYLTTLSDDALPALMQAWEQVQGDEQTVYDPTCRYDDLFFPDYSRPAEAPAPTEECATTLETILYRHLTTRWHDYEDSTDWRRWQSAHLARWRAYRALSNETYPELDRG